MRAMEITTTTVVPPFYIVRTFEVRDNSTGEIPLGTSVFKKEYPSRTRTTMKPMYNATNTMADYGNNAMSEAVSLFSMMEIGKIFRLIYSYKKRKGEESKVYCCKFENQIKPNNFSRIYGCFGDGFHVSVDYFCYHHVILLN